MKIKFTESHRLVRFPQNAELAIALIKAELKNEKVMVWLSQIGFDSTSCTLGLTNTILALADFNDFTDEVSDWYYNLLDRYVEKVVLEDVNKIHELAFNFYTEIVAKKRELEALDQRVRS